MSRITEPLDNNVKINRGSDPAIGYFFDVQDKRFANSGRDEQGEGFVCEFSTMFGIYNNKAGLTMADLEMGEEVIIEKCNKFIERLESGELDEEYPIL